MSLGINTITNFFGQGCSTVINILLVPIYIRYLGVEGYGLIGIFALIQAWFGLLDLGVGQTFNRELALFEAGKRSNESIRDLFASAELLLLVACLAVISFFLILSSWVVNSWLNIGSYSAAEATFVLKVIGVIIGIKFLDSLYRSVLLGFQRQAILNLANTIFVIIRGVGSVVILEYFGSTISSFFIWQALASIFGMFAFRFLSYQLLPIISRKASFALNELKKIKKFAADVFFINVTQIILTSIDKIVLTRYITLEQFGYYTLAGSIAGIIYQCTAPVSQALYPRMSELIGKSDTNQIVRNYRIGSEIIACIVIPITLVVVTFGKQIILLWTSSDITAINVYPLCIILSIATMFNSIMHMPGILALADGMSRYGVIQNTIGILFLAPISPYIATNYGSSGVASLWMIFNILSAAFGSAYVLNKLLRSELILWYRYGVIQPILISALISAIINYVIVQTGIPSKSLLTIVISLIINIICVSLFQPSIRVVIVKTYETISKRLYTNF